MRGRVVEQHTLRADRGRNVAGGRVGREMVEAVHQQHRICTRRDEAVDDRPQSCDCAREVVVGVEPGRGEVALGELPRAHGRAVGCSPRVERAERVELGAAPSPVDEGVEPEAGEELRELRGMAERVGDVGDRRYRSECARHRAAEQEVADMGLAGRQQRVGLHIPWPRREPPGVKSRDDLVATIGPHVEIVLEHDRLPVEHEAKARVDRDEVEHRVDRVDEPSAKRLERSVPLPVPVEVGDEQNVARQTETT